jgi:pteridine reductase
MKPLALVIGGSRRVGAAIAMELARGGFDLVVTWRGDHDGAQAIQREARAIGGACELMQLDLSEVGRHGVHGQLGLDRLDALVLSAAAWDPSPWGQLQAEAMAEQMRVNAFAPVLLAQALQPLLSASSQPGGGSVVAIGDVYADGAPVRGFGAYMLSKAALHQAVRQMAVEMAPRVRVNAVLPGVVAWPESIDASQREAILARVPLGRVGEPMDVARTVRFLCAEAPYITGAAIPVDGGRSLR